MRLFEKTRRVRLGVTRGAIIAQMQEMERVSPVDEIPTELLAVRVMARLQSACFEEWCEADKAGFDWDSLQEFISVVVEMLMPFIVMQRPPIPVYTHGGGERVATEG